MAIEWCQVCGSSVWSGQPCGKCAHDGIVAARDAEIARLKAWVERLTGELTDADQVTRDALGHARAAWEGERKRLESDLAAHKRALAAGPAALRARGHLGESLYAEIVEAAQEAAMKEKP